jgi:penicillin-binding protein 2
MERDRGFALIIFASVLFGILFIRLFTLQIIQGSRYRRLARENCIKPVFIKAPRGKIWDRNGIILADTRPAYSVIIPDSLETIFGLKFKKLAGLRLSRDVPFETMCKIEERKEEFPWASCIIEPARRYVYSDTICHLIGYVGEISRDEINQEKYKNYRPGDFIGKAGIEKKYESFLKGKDGVKYVEVDAKGNEIGPLPEKEAFISPISGNDIILGLDLGLQKICVKSLSNFKAGAIICMNPMDGSILAYTSKPGFDPNLSYPGMPQVVWDSLSSDKLSPFLDRVKDARYPPASIFKLVTAACGIDNGIVNSSSFMPISCEKGIQIGNRFFKCWKKHGRLNLIDAITQSCDVYFYQLGMKLGIDAIGRYADKFGLGQKTGIDLSEEQEGLIPTRNWYDRKYGKNKWREGVVCNLAVGQGEILTTPLQILVLTSSIANGGWLVEPRVINSIISPEGDTIYTSKIKKRRVQIKDETLLLLKRAMYEVVNNEKGTGSLARVHGIEVAGKTGSAENPHGEDHAWFCAFAPYDNPEICVVVFIENGGMGGGVAAPIAGEIIKDYFLNPKSESTKSEYPRKSQGPGLYF